MYLLRLHDITISIWNALSVPFWILHLNPPWKYFSSCPLYNEKATDTVYFFNTFSICLLQDPLKTTPSPIVTDLFLHPILMLLLICWKINFSFWKIQACEGKQTANLVTPHMWKSYLAFCHHRCKSPGMSADPKEISGAQGEAHTLFLQAMVWSS